MNWSVHNAKTLAAAKKRQKKELEKYVAQPVSVSSLDQIWLMQHLTMLSTQGYQASTNAPPFHPAPTGLPQHPAAGIQAQTYAPPFQPTTGQLFPVSTTQPVVGNPHSIGGYQALGPKFPAAGYPASTNALPFQPGTGLQAPIGLPQHPAAAAPIYALPFQPGTGLQAPIGLPPHPAAGVQALTNALPFHAVTAHPAPTGLPQHPAAAAPIYALPFQPGTGLQAPIGLPPHPAAVHPASLDAPPFHSANGQLFPVSTTQPVVGNPHFIGGYQAPGPQLQAARHPASIDAPPSHPVVGMPHSIGGPQLPAVQYPVSTNAPPSHQGAGHQAPFSTTQTAMPAPIGLPPHPAAGIQASTNAPPSHPVGGDQAPLAGHQDPAPGVIQSQAAANDPGVVAPRLQLKKELSDEEVQHIGGGITDARKIKELEKKVTQLQAQTAPVAHFEKVMKDIMEIQRKNYEELAQSTHDRYRDMFQMVSRNKSGEAFAPPIAFQDLPAPGGQAAPRATTAFAPPPAAPVFPAPSQAEVFDPLLPTPGDQAAPRANTLTEPAPVTAPMLAPMLAPPAPQRPKTRKKRETQTEVRARLLEEKNMLEERKRSQQEARRLRGMKYDQF